MRTEAAFVSSHVPFVFGFCLIKLLGPILCVIGSVERHQRVVKTVQSLTFVKGCSIRTTPKACGCLRFNALVTDKPANQSSGPDYQSNYEDEAKQAT